jgi:hypothetical protein
MKKNNQTGQALIELIIFLPLMFMFYSMISGFANAINASINQQKVTRAYFYYKVQNNSTIPKPSAPYGNWTRFGMYFIGWADYLQNGADESGQPVAPCYRLTVPLAVNTDDKCETKYTKTTSQYIRVQTVYGVCGATYERHDAVVQPVPDFSGGDFSGLITRDSCIISR